MFNDMKFYFDDHHHHYHHQQVASVVVSVNATRQVKDRTVDAEVILVCGYLLI